MTATTVGFAIEERDRARLQHLADRFGGGNRSAFLRKAMDVMERYELAQRLVELQAYGEERLAASGATAEDIPALVERALTDPDPSAVSQAKLIVAGIAMEDRTLRHHRAAPVPSLRDLIDEVR